jgi:hypothetical protein
LLLFIWFVWFCFALWEKLLKLVLYCLSQAPAHFALVILEMGSHKLFAQAGLKPQSS